MLSREEIEYEGNLLYQAEVNREQVEPVTLRHPNMTLEDGYAIQKHWLDRKISDGRRLIGYKIGYTSRAMQKALNINEPDYGVLLDDMLYQDGSEIDSSMFSDPRIEVELAFVLKDRLEGNSVTIVEVLNATDYVIPALELIDARSYRVHPETGYSRKVFDTIADNAGNAAIIMGGRPVKPLDMDIRWCGGLLYKNGVLEETGLAAGVLNHPANGICWVARRFAPHGISLEPGQIILSGSFTAPVPVSQGNTITADYGRLGNVSCHFS